MANAMRCLRSLSKLHVARLSRCDLDIRGILRIDSLRMLNSASAEPFLTLLTGKIRVRPAGARLDSVFRIPRGFLQLAHNAPNEIQKMIIEQLFGNSSNIQAEGKPSVPRIFYSLHNAQSLITLTLPIALNSYAR